MTTYKELADYLEALPNDVPGLKQVTVGRDEEELSLQSSGIIYPHLRVDTPDLVYGNDGENPITRYNLRFFLLDALPEQGNYALETQTLSDLEAMMRAIYNKIWDDADSTPPIFDLVLNTNRASEPIRKWSGDNCFGWVMNISIELYTATC